MTGIFLSAGNVKDMTAYIGRDVSTAMRSWAASHDLDDYESVQSDNTETLDFVNAEFAKEHKDDPYELDMADGQNYPKYYIHDGVERYNVNDWRSHDAQFTQEVYRDNSDFRYGNKIKKWQTSMSKRHYDRDTHVDGLRDIRELDTIHRGYNMDKIYAGNAYISADSVGYGY